MHYAQNQVALIKLQTLTLRGETRGNESASVGRGTKTLPFVINLGVCVCVCQAQTSEAGHRSCDKSVTRLSDRSLRDVKEKERERCWRVGQQDSHQKRN